MQIDRQDQKLAGVAAQAPGRCHLCAYQAAALFNVN